MRLALTIGAVAGMMTCHVATAQVPAERIFTLHSRATGQCPALDWHIALEGQTNLSGLIGWDDMKGVARVIGKVNPTNRTFAMTAQEVDGQNRTAEITGQVRDDGWMVANITGAVTCSNIEIPWFHPGAGVNR